MGSCRESCGRCCDPVTLPFDLHAVLTAGPDILDPRDRRWVLEDLTPISRRTGLAEADYLTGGCTTFYNRLTGAVELVWTQFYRCRWYDADARSCTNYDGRPPMCEGYPWYGDPPEAEKVLPPECGYNVDVGRVPVALTRKEQRHA